MKVVMSKEVFGGREIGGRLLWKMEVCGLKPFFGFMEGLLVGFAMVIGLEKWVLE